MAFDQQGAEAHEFGALNTLLLVVVLGLCIISAYLIKEHKIYYLPESAAALLVGLIVGGLARLIYPSKEELKFLTFEPELFFFLLLPPIIFEAGYSLKKKDFFANIWTISLFAVGGTIVSTFIVGYLVYLVGVMGLVPIDTSSPMEALLFGALLSAIDPVATLSILGNPELRCEPLLYSLVFGESVLNDAVAIVLFKTFMKFYDLGEEFTSATVPSVLWDFTLNSVGSIFVGLITSLLCCYLCKNTQMRRYPELETSIIFLFAYGSYAFSEALELSGIMSLFFAGVCLSHYNVYNLSATSKITANYIFKSLAVMSEFFVFLYMGMGFFIGRWNEFYFLFIILVVIFCLIGRVANVFPMTFIANLGRQKKVPFNMQVMIWFAGLRGAIAFALSQNMPGAHRDVYISTTLSVVILTTVVCGGLTEPMLTRLGMKSVSDDKPGDDDGHQYEQLVWNAEDGGRSTPTSNGGGGGVRAQRAAMTGMSGFWHRFDNLYMKPYFGGTGATGNEGPGLASPRATPRANTQNPMQVKTTMTMTTSTRTAVVGKGGGQ